MQWQLRGDRPIYQQLVEKLTEQIVSGQLNAGDKVPPVRELAAQAGVNPNTMQRALADLEREGLMFTNRTSGRFVTEDKAMIEKVREEIASDRINEFLDQPELPKKQPVEKNPQKADAPFVSMKNVSFGYDDRLVLENLNFQVNTGEQVTLAGRTGAGKSTIFKLLLGLYRPSKGTVLIDGMPAADIPEKTKRKLFGYVEQSFHMVPGTVKDQITLFDENITMEDVKAAAQLTGLADTIEELEKGYDTICTPELFSQGQWQLLSIARAAAASPKLLLLDEITANLDAETEKEVLQALRRISENRTVISISHRVTAKTGRVITIA